MAYEQPAVPSAMADTVELSVITASGEESKVSLLSSGTVADLRAALTDPVADGCHRKLVQGKVLIDSMTIASLSTEEPIFAVVLEGTKLDAAYDAAESYEGYAEVLQKADIDSEAGVAISRPFPTILEVIEGFNVTTTDLGDSKAWGTPRLFLLKSSESKILSFSGDDQKQLILPALDLKPFQESAGKETFSRVSFCVGINSDASNDGLGFVLEASPYLDATIDDKGLPSYVYDLGNGYGKSDGKRANAIKFHPGMGGGQIRVEGAGGFSNTSMTFTPQNWSESGKKLTQFVITLGADGKNDVTAKSPDGKASWTKGFEHQIFDGRYLPALHAWVDYKQLPVFVGEITLRAV